MHHRVARPPRAAAAACAARRAARRDRAPRARRRACRACGAARRPRRRRRRCRSWLPSTVTARVAERLHEAQAAQRIGAAVDEVAHEPEAVARGIEGERVEQPLERLVAALQVADRRRSARVTSPRRPCSRRRPSPRRRRARRCRPWRHRALALQRAARRGRRCPVFEPRRPRGLVAQLRRARDTRGVARGAGGVVGRLAASAPRRRPWRRAAGPRRPRPRRGGAPARRPGAWHSDRPRQLRHRREALRHRLVADIAGSSFIERAAVRADRELHQQDDADDQRDRAERDPDRELHRMGSMLSSGIGVAGHGSSELAR